MATIPHLVLRFAQLHLPARALTKNHAARNVARDLELKGPQATPLRHMQLKGRSGAENVVRCARLDPAGCGFRVAAARVAASDDGVTGGLRGRDVAGEQARARRMGPTCGLERQHEAPNLVGW